MTPPVTVLMSVYNGLPHVKEAVESILKQTFTNFNFLIFDDASTDGTSQVLANYAQQDSRIKVITNKHNQGLGYNLASGLEIAQTPWIARMDADDIAVVNRLELQMAYVQEHPEIDILGGYALDISDRGEILSRRQVPTFHDAIYRLIWTNPFIHGTVLLNRESIIQVGSYSRKLAKRQDYELWFRCAVAGLKFANIPVPLIHYRFSDNTFQRNDWKVALTHVLIGWRGCWQIGTSFFAYLAITKQLIVVLLPSPLRYLTYSWLKKFDPRTKAN